MTGIIIGIVILIIVAVIIALTSGKKKYGGRKPKTTRGKRPTGLDDAEDRAVKAAGNFGEACAKDIIKTVLSSDDILLNNVKIEYDGSPCEMDNVVINKKGVFIIEVKFYKGIIQGKENDFEWDKYKFTNGGNLYEKKVKNPIVQVRRQEGLLGNFLRNHGVDVWVKGYAYMLEGNSPVVCDAMLEDRNDIGKVIHSGGNELSPREVEKIRKLLQKG